MLKIEFYTSKLVNPNIQDPLTEIGCLTENVPVDLVILYTTVSSAFLCVCLINVLQFLGIESTKFSGSFLSLTIFRFI